jgi:CheY-like chemotaxis protein
MGRGLDERVRDRLLSRLAASSIARKNGTFPGQELRLTLHPALETPWDQRAGGRKPMTMPSVVLMQSEISVLVVCDPVLLTLINRCLISVMGGCRVFKAQSGQEAISLYEQHQEEIDVVLLNLFFLPGMDGRAVFEALRTINPNVRCAIMTATFDEDIKTDLMSRGVVGWLQKPFKVEQLIAGVREWSLR